MSGSGLFALVTQSEGESTAMSVTENTREQRLVSSVRVG